MSKCKTYACVVNKSGRCIHGLQSLKECEAYRRRTPEHEAVVKTLHYLVANYRYDLDAEKNHKIQKGRAFFSGSRNANMCAIHTLARNWIRRNRP